MTAVEKSTRRVYSAEELYRLRGSCSQPRLREAIEEHEGEDAELVKEHVLRGSKSFAARSFRSRVSGNSLRAPQQKENRSTTDADSSRQSAAEDLAPRVPVLGEIQPNNQVLRPGLWRLRPSPTPTLTKKAAEAIVKAHGSPQHVRVTAGGRIVPSEQSPLCHPRYGYSAIKANGGLVKFAPNHPMGQKQQWTQATQNGFVAQDIEGRLCQIVNGTILPLTEVDGALRLYIPAPNLNINGSRNASFGQALQQRVNSPQEDDRQTSQSQPAPTEPSSAAQANALELEYSKLEHELRELDKTEVLHGRTMGKVAKDALVSKRRELVISMDNIRKAIKGLKNQPPPPDAPLSPRDGQNRQSASPPGRNRLPSFLQHRLNETIMPPMSTAFGNFLSALPGHGQPGQFGFQPSPLSDVPYLGQACSMPPPGVYMAPPSFDGPIGQGFAAPQSQDVIPAVVLANNSASKEDSIIPQTDGAWSFANRQKLTSPRVSRAVDIKAPEPKQTACLKSTLNPMSPAYKPAVGMVRNGSNVEPAAARSVKDRPPTPMSPSHQLRAAGSVSVRNLNPTDDTTNNTSKMPHLHSSSVSSFQTADFFPRNTREYSTRNHDHVDKSEDKENIDPTHTPATPNDDGLSYTASDPVRLAQTPGFHGPAAPPGTPMSSQLANENLPVTSSINAMPNRQIDDLSPKGKRNNWTFVQEHPGQTASDSDRINDARHELCVTVSPEKLDFTQASVEWIQGYRAGLGRKIVAADCDADFMDGYCAGMLKSNPKINGPSTGSPTRNPARRASPAGIPSRSSSHQKMERHQPAPVRPTLENSLESMDTLKEAILAPHNESAILTPAADGPHINAASFNLEGWAKYNSGQGYPFPDGSALNEYRSLGLSEGPNSEQRAAKYSASIPATEQRPNSSLSSTNAASLTVPNNVDKRVGSITSIDSNLYRQYPGHRVFSPHLEWRSTSSVAQAAEIATGCFTNRQFGGSSTSVHGHSPSLPGSGQEQRQGPVPGSTNPVMVTHSRFREASLDGLSDPASPPMSPSLLPKDNASPQKTKKHSPAKTGSPAKAKFENIAEKVGIKVAKDNSPNSPPGKRRWRNVWLGGKKDDSKDETV